MCQEKEFLRAIAEDIEFTHFNKQYILKLSQSGSMEDAKTICKNQDMVLFEPRNSSTYDFVIEKAIDKGMSKIWLNIGRDDPESPFKYFSDNSSLAWKNWARYEPNNHEGKGENCVQTHWHGPWQSQWMDVVCVNDGTIICQSQTT